MAYNTSVIETQDNADDNGKGKTMETANRARAKVDELFARAERRRDYPAEYLTLDRRAREADAAWELAYPHEAAIQRADDLEWEADDEDARAAGALVHDADGALDREAREAIAETHRAKAAELRAIGARLRDLI